MRTTESTESTRSTRSVKWDVRVGRATTGALFLGTLLACSAPTAPTLVGGETAPVRIEVNSKAGSTVEVPIRFRTPPSGLAGYKLHISVPDGILLASYTQPQWAGLVVKQGKYEDGVCRIVVVDLGKRWGGNQDITLVTLRLIPDSSGVVRVSIPQMDDDGGNPIPVGRYEILLSVN